MKKIFYGFLFFAMQLNSKITEKLLVHKDKVESLKRDIKSGESDNNLKHANGKKNCQTCKKCKRTCKNWCIARK